LGKPSDKLNEVDYAYDWAAEVSGKMKQYITTNEFEPLVHYSEQGLAFNLAIPTPEHYLPMIYTLALKEDTDTVQIFNDKAVAGSLTMTSLKIS
jgi:4,5-DOPA dioxygenase extradiol